ncbi:hypothetical protein L6R49_08515 [Myxococcota bacterium]|nr:hypothetical protein [Myxococcota bacterium]
MSTSPWRPSTSSRRRPRAARGSRASPTPGRPRPTAWLLFRGPHPPIPTIVEAGRLLQALDGQRSFAEAAALAGLAPAQADELAEALRALGALTG